MYAPPFIHVLAKYLEPYAPFVIAGALTLGLLYIVYENRKGRKAEDNNE